MSLSKNDLRKKDKAIDLKIQSLPQSSNYDFLYAVIEESRLHSIKVNDQKNREFDKIILGEGVSVQGATYYAGGKLLTVFLKTNEILSGIHNNNLKRMVIDPEMGAFYISSLGSHRYLIGINRAQDVVGASDRDFFDLSKQIVSALASR